MTQRERVELPTSAQLKALSNAVLVVRSDLRMAVRTFDVLIDERPSPNERALMLSQRNTLAMTLRDHFGDDIADKK